MLNKNYKLQGLFIILIILGTTVDFYLRQIFYNSATIINTMYLGILLVSIFIFNKSTITASNNKKSFIVKSTPQLRPLYNLINTKDPLLILRFFAAFLVFVRHSAILLQPNKSLFYGKGFMFLGNAHAGMAIFFTISGFLMCKAFLYGRYELTREGILFFYVSRWIRIFPLMCFVAIFLIVLQYPQVLRFEPLELVRVFSFNYYGNTLGLNGIGAMWSLSVEFQYYLIAPFIFSIFNSIIEKNKIIGIASIIIVIAFFTAIKTLTRHYVAVNHFYDPNFFSLLGNLPFFLIGFLFNYININISTKVAKFIMQDAVLLLELIGFFILLSYLQKHNVMFFLYVSIISGVIIASLDKIRAMPVILAKSKFSVMNLMQGLGVLSYGFYLWHSGIGYVYSKLFVGGFTDPSAYLMEVLISGSIVLLVSFFSYIVIEDRFNSYKYSYQVKDPESVTGVNNIIMQN